MPRSIVFGNQSLLVCLDNNYFIRDIYWPHVGMDNHVNGHKCRIGVWTDGKFSWLSSSDWKKEIKYQDDTLLGESQFINEKISLKLTIYDCVYYKSDIFIRKIIIQNLSSADREVRIFFSQDLQIYGIDVGITAYYDTDLQSIIHYLKNRWFLFNGRGNKSQNIDSFATGKAHFGDSEGTFKDAEDGRLSENAIDQGSVDSTIQLNLEIEANKTAKAYYWMCVGNDYKDVQKLNQLVSERGIDELIEHVISFDKTWVNKTELNFFEMSDMDIKLYKQSLLIIKSQMDKSGAIMAANDSDILQFNRDHYSYLWPRDGALVALSLDRAGYAFLTRKFYKFCSDVVTSKGFLLHKYNPDGSVGSSWHPWYSKEEGLTLAIQEDETALVLYAIWEHYEQYEDFDLIADLYTEFILPAADFMVEFRDERDLPLPSYDLWEERRGIHTFTVSSVYAGLKAASKFAKLFGDKERKSLYSDTAERMKDAMVEYLYDDEKQRFLRTINFDDEGNIKKDMVMDASLYSIFEFGVFSSIDPKVKSTMEQIEDRLWVKTDVGGMARYENDYYHRISDNIEDIAGNPWYICTLWLAEWYFDMAREQEEQEKKNQNTQKGLELIRWVSDRCLDSCILAEQVDPYSNEPISVSPLTWSHATYVITIHKYLKAFSDLKRCKSCGRPLSIRKDKFDNIRK